VHFLPLVKGGQEGFYNQYFHAYKPLAKGLNNDVAANFSLRVLFYFNALQTQAKACGYQNRTFARASYECIIKID
jgi:hypothetical protein